MNRKRLLLIILVIVLIIIAAVAAYITSPSWLPQSTTLQITPAGGAAASGSKTAFTVVLSAGKTEITGNVSWTVSAGSLDKTSGMTVIFTAPTVTANESVTVNAKFGGQGVYQPSSATTQLTVTPPPPVQMIATSLKVSPSVFQALPGYVVPLSASLTDNSGNALTGKTITWSISPSGTGSLSSTTGTSVNYTAPTVQANTSVAVSASFAGDGQYLASSDSSQGSILPQAVVLKTSTVLKVSPSTSTVQSGGSVVLSASLSDKSGNPLSGETVTWSISPSGTGSLSSTTGTSVTYTAPTVQANTSVTISVAFAGDDKYLGSSDSSLCTVTPLPSISQSDLYIVTFDDALMTNVKIQGPIMINGTSVTMISADIANVTTITLSHVNLNATEMDITQAQFFVTYANFGTESGSGGINITGGQSVNIGPIGSVTYENGVMYVVRMVGSGATLSNFTSAAEQIGGTEPYLPNLITTPECDISQVYHIDGPVSYGLLNQASSSITMGRIDITQFSFEHPKAYNLDRPDNTYTATNRWLLKSASATGLNIKAYMIYFQCTAIGVTVTATGEDSMIVDIPYGYNSGRAVSVFSLAVHAIYFTGDYLQLGSFTLSIE